MVFAALDYWHARKRPLAGRPAAGTPLYEFIVDRLVESWHLPAGVAEYYHWMNLPDGDESVSLLHRSLTTERGVAWRTIEQQWPQIKASIDSGTPAALGLVTVASANPADLGHNHQVLACGYTADGASVTIGVYDPNSGQDDFVTAYSPASPPAAAAGPRETAS